ncbi:hypothetical protein H6G89_31845 [Oscillatoria sp. FACHB-1407]|uniref:hypothetical protein n=1 Tax=Oscillatoria sp. FACHB-1407 TaxID=2692847 RepID=UPI001683EB8F|nr:hypothetical protein [Oscillatoria sp. FACHB-1407]MBD2465588.1 hypothetical protein [Oscillatoria sp. FACHB-1407]
MDQSLTKRQKASQRQHSLLHKNYASAAEFAVSRSLSLDWTLPFAPIQLKLAAQMVGSLTQYGLLLTPIEIKGVWHEQIHRSQPPQRSL